MRRVLVALLCALAVAKVDHGHAQPYPTKPVSMIVPFPAGGPSDTLARLLAQSMAAPLGQSVTVENVGGAGGTIGSARVAQAKPDGYTTLITSVGHATSATLYRKLPYDPVESFDTIGLIAEVPMTIVARKDFAPQDTAALLTHIRANKTNVSYANAGIGSASHLCGLLLMSALKTEMNVVSYRGTAPAMNDLLGGRIDVLCDQTTNTSGPIRAGSIKAYAVTTKGRVASVAQLPSLHESGLPNFELTIWYGLFAPKGTPKQAVDQLSNAVRVAIADPALVKRLEDLGAQPVSADRTNPANFAKYLRDEVAKWAPIIKAAGQYAD